MPEALRCIAIKVRKTCVSLFDHQRISRRSGEYEANAIVRSTHGPAVAGRSTASIVARLPETASLVGP
jgi:hypothetical protein